jgi:phage baseplate assembly protein W
MAEPTNAAERVSLEYGMLSLRDVVREDVNTAEGSTTMTRSGAVKEYVFSDQEMAVRHNYKVVDEAVQAWLKKNK